MIYDVLFENDRFTILNDKGYHIHSKKEDLFEVIMEMEEANRDISFRFSKPALKEIGIGYREVPRYLMVLVVFNFLLSVILTIGLCNKCF